ncbi:MAG TPA: hypothetical protein HA354_01405 [Candidatus Poseidoniaceae archaeon]|nr:hypothetical protein [Euryarchaeota archaeon]DAC59787.1 MAG TPA: hypothetical protein D7I07_01390 [Candidatus Poseidoniales archaeon]HII37136.1 hypothetical protein [Candidatus Poseidoniaceae archaeon]|tara:strand:+ start:273 stop:695 length:423 start_codon:yes stop_codon:yes gene_type:complete
MRTVPEWRWFTLAGLVLVAQTMLDIAPEGPWGADSFTRGVIGLTGLICIYLGWFRFTFKQVGIIPSINRWQKPESSWKLVLLFSCLCLVFLLIINNTSLSEILPETAGMIVLLVASLSMLNGLYVGLVVSGPLNDQSGEE